jgi:thiamine biosynthesis lipoprotein
MKLISGFILASLIIGPISATIPAANREGDGRHLYISHFENVLGTSMELKIYGASPEVATMAETAALNEIRRLGKILSAYDAESEFSRWLLTSQQPVHISPELFEVLALFDQWRMRSGGVLDASAEVVSQLWKKAAARQSIPTAQELADAVAAVKEPHWRLDATNQTAVHLGNAPLMLNSFVKSYIIKRATDIVMAAEKVNAIVLNIGGDLVVRGNLNETIQISDPRADAENETPLDQLQINNKAVATSGNYRRGEKINGQWYSHIVDPRTGLPADDILSSTVVAPSATDAGALATAFNVMTPAESVKFAASIPGVEYLIITKKGERITSKGWSALEKPMPIKSHEKTGSGWANDFELLINLEINLQKQGFVKRPYVALWIEDENHAAIKTVSLWHQRDKWLPELKSWYLKYRGLYTADNSIFNSVTSATRSAGKYSVKWDGKDDKGNFVKPGKYTVKIEAAREHGTYQLMRQEIDLDETPKTISIPGGVEIASATLDYRKKTNGN